MIEVIRFTASWCGPCRMYKSQFEKAENECHGVTFKTVDVENDTNGLAGQYGVRNIPFTAFIKDGALADTQTGVIKAQELIDKIKNL